MSVSDERKIMLMRRSTMTWAENARYVYDIATPGEIREGLDWYPAANAYVCTLAAKFGITESQAAGVIAVISPRMHWTTNVRRAYEICESFVNGKDKSQVTGVFQRNLDKAYAILSDKYNVPEYVRGNKVGSFYRNLLGDSDSVTVDTWVWRALTLAMDATPQRISDTEYTQMEEIVRVLASEDEVRPCDYQAILWVVIRNISRSEKGLGDL